MVVNNRSLEVNGNSTWTLSRPHARACKLHQASIGRVTGYFCMTSSVLVLDALEAGSGYCQLEANLTP
jgi:hypothetical protein